MTHAIEISNLHKSYGTFEALKGISFKIKRGDFFSFLGPNGAGKTTTIHAISGLVNYQSGSIQVLGKDVIHHYREVRRSIGLCGQEFNFDPFLDIRRLLIYQAGYFGVKKAEASDRADCLLKKFRLDHKKKLTFRTLSGGMKRRLLLCRALIHDPEILILDEPTAGADLELKHLIWEYLKEINDDGKTVFLTTHYMEEAEELSKSIAILHQGNLVRIGDKKTVLQGKSLENVFLDLTKVDG